MINSLQFLSLIGVSFFGTLGFITTFWFAGIVRTNIVWFVSILTITVFGDAPIISFESSDASVPSIEPAANVVTHRSSSVRIHGTLSIRPIVRPVSKIYSAADRERTLSGIRVCRIDNIPTLVDPESFSIVELRYEPNAVPFSIVNPETIPTSDIFGP